MGMQELRDWGVSKHTEAASGADTRFTAARKVIGDESGLGTIAGVGTLATLAYLATKLKDQKLLAKAIKGNIPINKNIVNPVIAALAGGGTALAGKHFYDKYNKEDWEY